MDNPGETLPTKLFALSFPDRSDPEFDRVREHLVDTVMRTAMRLRVQCAAKFNISIFDTEATITPDVNRPNVIEVTARPIARRSPHADQP